MGKICAGKRFLIDESRHLVLKAAHPLPPSRRMPDFWVAVIFQRQMNILSEKVLIRLTGWFKFKFKVQKIKAHLFILHSNLVGE